MALLLYLDHDGNQQRVPITGPVTIGRDPDCAIVINLKTVSRIHARVMPEQGALVLEDLESGKGTFYRGQKISQVKLKEGDQFCIGDVEFSLELGESDMGNGAGKKPSSRSSMKPSTRRRMQADDDETEEGSISPRMSRMRGKKDNNATLTAILIILIVLNIGWFLKTMVSPTEKSQPAATGSTDTDGSSQARPELPKISFEGLARQFREEGRESLAALIDYHRALIFEFKDAEVREKLRQQAQALSQEKSKEEDVLKQLFFILHEEMSGHKDSARESRDRLFNAYPDKLDRVWIESFYEDLKEAYEVGATEQLQKAEVVAQEQIQDKSFEAAIATWNDFQASYPLFIGAFEIERRIGDVERLMGSSVSDLRARVESLAQTGNWAGAMDLFRLEVSFYPANAPGMNKLRQRVQDIQRLAAIEELQKTAGEFVQQYEFALAFQAYEELADLTRVADDRIQFEEAAIRQRTNAAWFASLQLSLAKKRLRQKNKFEQDDESIHVIVSADERGYYYYLKGESSLRSKWKRNSWRQIVPETIADIAVRLKWLQPEMLVSVIEWCIEIDLTEQGLLLAKQLQKKRSMEETAQHLVAKLLGIPESQGPFVIYKAEWMTEASKIARKANAAEEKRLAREKKERERYLANAKANYQKAMDLMDRDKFKDALEGFKVISKVFDDTKWGTMAARIVAGNCYLKTNDLLISGPSDNRMDVVIMGDGFMMVDQVQFNGMVAQGKNFFTNFPAIKEYVNYWNFYWMSIASNSRKIPAPGEVGNTALGSTLSGAGGLPVADRGKVMDMLRNCPVNDGLAIVFAREGGGGTGGGGIGIFGGDPGGILIHEFFGHAFTGLADEYTRNLGQQPLKTNAINISISPDPDKTPWAHWIKAGRENIGVFLGGNGHEVDHWRPTPGQCNLAEAGGKFCAVCREEFVLKMYSYVNPIDEATPNMAPLEYVLGSEEEIYLIPMKPTSADLKVEFYIEFVTRGDSEAHERVVYEPLQCVARSGLFDIAGGSRPRMRRRRNATLPAIHGTRVRAYPFPMADGNKRYVIPLHKLKRQLIPGSWQISARVWDETDWVILDPMNLLEERRFWELNVVKEATPEEEQEEDDE